MAIEAII